MLSPNGLREGGVKPGALDCVANGLLLRKGPFENVWIQPDTGDAGGARRAAAFVWYHLISRFERAAAEQPRGGLLRELWGFLAQKKKGGQLPVLILLLGVLVMLAGTGSAPFIYTLF